MMAGLWDVAFEGHVVVEAANATEATAKAQEIVERASIYWLSADAPEIYETEED